MADIYYSSSSSSCSCSSSSFSSSSSSSFSWSSCGSLSSSSYSSVVRFVSEEKLYRCLVVKYATDSEYQVIFVIKDYERLFRDPLSSGKFVCVSKSTLNNKFVDSQDTLFWWSVTTYNDGVVVENPVLGSQSPCSGKLLDITQVLRSYVD